MLEKSEQENTFSFVMVKELPSKISQLETCLFYDPTQIKMWRQQGKQASELPRPAHCLRDSLTLGSCLHSHCARADSPLT